MTKKNIINTILYIFCGILSVFSFYFVHSDLLILKILASLGFAAVLCVIPVLLIVSNIYSETISKQRYITIMISGLATIIAFIIFVIYPDLELTFDATLKKMCYTILQFTVITAPVIFFPSYGITLLKKMVIPRKKKIATIILWIFGIIEFAIIMFSNFLAYSFMFA